MVEEGKKKKMGRPPDYCPAMCDMVLEFMSEGASVVECARHLKVCRDTIYDWMKKHPDFAKAVKTGRDWSEARNAEIIRMIALGQIPKANMEAYKMYMRNTTDWDKNVNTAGVVNQTMNIGNINQVNVLQDKSQEELIEYINDIAQDVKGVLDVTEFVEIPKTVKKIENDKSE